MIPRFCFWLTIFDYSKYLNNIFITISYNKFKEEKSMSTTSLTQEISEEIIQKTKIALENHGINVIIVDNKEEAFNLMKGLIPDRAEVMTGSSTTLQQIGFMDYYISNDHPWVNIGSPIFLEKDKQKQAEMRRKSVSAQYFTASVNAITEEGELVSVDGLGSRVGAYPFAAEKLILVSGINKIVPTLSDAFDRIKNVVYPQENERAQKRYGRTARFGKWVIIENEVIKDRITLILIKEELGF